jgi:hypothetical protein
VLVAFVGLFFVGGGKAPAIPLFAHQYGVTCEKCHSVIPHLNRFGAAFLAFGERLPGVSSGPAFPISLKLNLVDSSQNQGSGPDGAGLPKAIVDEVEAFTSATVGSRANVFVEQYIVDGGEHGLLRDAWIEERLDPWDARIAWTLQAGQFTLPLPVDPETFRDTYQAYTPYVQTVGGNPFTFYDPKMGVRVGAGNPLRGLNVNLFAGPGYDRASGLAKTGVDTFVDVAQLMGPIALSLFRYDGLRPAGSGNFDRFERTGYGFTYGQWTRFSSETVLLSGWDSNCGVPGHTGCASSGGFEQVRYSFDRRLFAETRYEGTNDPSGGFTRDGVVLLGYGPTENTRLTVEDVISQQPRPSNTMNVQATVAY